MTSGGGTSLTGADGVEAFAALANETRLEAWRLLSRHRPHGLAAGDVARLLATPANTLSTHLAILERAGLVRSRREGRSILYAADPEQAQRLIAFLNAVIGQTEERRDLAADRSRPCNVLIVCKGNSARSIMAEAILGREGRGRFQVFSAGSRPASAVNPHALALLRRLGYPIEGLRPKSWSAFARPGEPEMDFIITVCDAAAGEDCPIQTGEPIRAHWGVPDPAAAQGSDAEKRAAMTEAYRRLSARVSAFVALPAATMDGAKLQARLKEIGRMDGASPMATRD